MVSSLTAKYSGIWLFTDHPLQGSFTYLVQKITFWRLVLADRNVLAPRLH